MSNKYIKSYYNYNTSNTVKPYYIVSSDSFLNKIYKINNDILNNTIPVDQIIDEINKLKEDFLLNDNPNNNNPNLILQNLLNLLDQQNKISDLNNEVIELMEEITILENTPCVCTCGKSGFTFDPINTSIDTQIRLDYTYYIKTCGIPNSGIYLEIIINIINNYLEKITDINIDLEYLVTIISQQTDYSIIVFNDEKKVKVYDHFLI